MFWVISSARGRNFDPDMALTVALFDLVIAALLGLSVILMGQAIASYEVFTGKSLPRQGLWRYWRRALVMAGGYSVVMSASLTLTIPPIYSVLLGLILIVVFFALLSWRSFGEREHYIRSLRTFASSQGVFEHLLSASQHEVDVVAPFLVLCEQVLQTQRARLIALGAMSSLMPEPLIYPELDVDMDLPPVDGMLASPELAGVPLHRLTDGVWMWAVPLWGARGLMGVLYLGAKPDGGLYTQEEIEVARSVGERLIDTLASAELARRLMALQRQQMAEGQVLDRRTRRALHDEVLPQLHAALLTMNSSTTDQNESIALLTQAHRRIADLLRKTPTITAPEVERLGLVAALHQTVDEELSGAFDQVTWDVSPQIEHKSRDLSPLSGEVVFYAAREAIRNAALHGRVANRSLHLRVMMSWNGGLEITIEDNGAGLEAGESSGSGHGLALHTTMMAVIGGSLTVESQPTKYSRVIIALPEAG
jgi:signal transduction histidine kinase